MHTLESYSQIQSDFQSGVIGTHATNVVDGRVYYHNTCVFEIRCVSNSRPYKAILRSGGYRTATTKRRINQSLDAFGFDDYYLFQRDGKWLLLTPNGVTVPFVEGMRI